jgi:subtilisin family serine protease
MQNKTNSQSAFFIFRLTAALALFLSAVFLALLGAGAFSNVFAQSKASAPARSQSAAKENVQLSPADKNGRFVYLVKFAEPGILHRQGRAADERFNPNTPAAQGHRAQVMAEQAAHVQGMTRALGRDLDVTHYFLVTHSGLAARFSPEEAQIVRTLPGVVSVERERLYNLTTFRGPTFIGANTIWDGSAVPGGVGTRGQGVVIGMLDTGVDPAHPSFANDPACGHGQGGAPNKLMSFLDCSVTGFNGFCEGPSPEDTNGHGSHTASTAGGNRLTSATVPPPTIPPPFTEMSGVAPCANIRAYKVCPANDCPEADIQAGMSSILLHGDVSVMNFSISGGDAPWLDNDRRKLDLVGAGVVIAASAGNTSAGIPDPVGQVNHLGPWVMTVAASTRDGDFSARVSAAGPGSPPADTQDIPLDRGSDSPVGVPLLNFPIRHFTQQPVAEGCTPGEDSAPADLVPFPPGFFNGSIALIQRGLCPFTKKIQNAFNAGAVVVLIRNNVPAPVSMLTTGQPNIPAYSMDQAPGIALVTFVDANPTNATANFDPSFPQPGDVLAGFSLRGPSSLPDLTKPDITAPGVNIYAAQPLKVVPAGYGNLSGTSMSSPHAAGAAALVRAVHPAWTPSEVKSALMMTAFVNGTKEDGITPWNPDDVGNGRVDLTKAARAGLVMHETFANYLAADPSTGGDPKTLNIPSVRNLNCTSSCTWTRTVRNTRTVPSFWSAAGAPVTPGFQLSVQPKNFSFTGNLGETQQLTITATPTTNLTGAIAFGNVVLTEATRDPFVERISVAISGQPLALGAVSRKSHGGAGNFDVDLPFTGTPGIECRAGGATNDYQLIVSFPTSVSVVGNPQAAVTSGTGAIGSGGISNGGAVSVSGSTVTVPLTNVANAQTIKVTLSGVSTGAGNGNVVIPMSVLVADTNGSGTVSGSDVAQTKARSGQPVAIGNFRSDVSTDGSINATDISLVKSRSGQALPP